METLKVLKSTQIIVLGICFVIATILSTVILSSALVKIKTFSSEVITVTGYAEKNVTSDLVVWRASFSRRGEQLAEVFGRLKNDVNAVKEYLLSKGVKPEELVISQVNTSTLYKKTEKGEQTNEIEGYVLSHQVEIKSGDVGRMTEISRQSTELIEKGIEFISESPEYIYMKLAELKVDMLAQASADARKRAEKIVSSAGNKIGLMRSARMGVFQITPINSTDVSDYGHNDTSSIEKKITAVVHVEFAIAE